MATGPSEDVVGSFLSSAVKTGMDVKALFNIFVVRFFICWFPYDLLYEFWLTFGARYACEGIL